MTLDDVLNLWEEDSKVDRLNLSNEIINISSLHSKYYKIYIHESLALKRQESEFKVLKLEKYQFYTEGPTQEQHDKGWRLPARGKILKAEVQNYMDADKDIINFTLKLALQKEKVDFLSDIIKSFTARGYNISSAIRHEIFKAGG